MYLNEYSQMQDDALLSRKEVSAALSARGLKISPQTLATMATRGGGPVYRTFGPRVLYRWADALAWAEGRLSAPRISTSEAKTKAA